MNQYFDVLHQVPLFYDMSDIDIETLLVCLKGRIKVYQKNEAIIRIGDSIDTIGIVLEGFAKIVKESLYGDEYLLSELEPQDMFAESFVFAEVVESPVSVVSVSDCVVLHLEALHLSQSCAKNCVVHHRVIERMLKILAQKNIALNNKAELLAQRSLREKLLHYLEREVMIQQSSTITIPFNRKELADYLCVDRSSMSRELSKMKEEGLLIFQKNQFVVVIKK